MPLQAAQYSTYKCGLLRYLSDVERDVTIPAGILLWNSQEHYLGVRIPKPDEERIRDINVVHAAASLKLVVGQLRGWIEDGELPLADQPLEPLSDEWWEHVSALLRHSVRVEPGRAVQVSNPEEELDTLYDALVQPQVSVERRVNRIDGAIARALGDLIPYYRKAVVPGYGGKDVKVMRMATDGAKIVVVEAVNLAAATAELDADAMFGKLSRVKNSKIPQRITYVLGYLASAGGLNGERPLKEFIEEKFETRMYDLQRERSEFHEHASSELADLDMSNILTSTLG